MKRIGSTLYIELQELVEAGVSENTIISGIHRGSSMWTHIKDPADNRRTLLAYEKLGKKYRQAIKDKYGDPYTIVERQEASNSWQRSEQLAESLRIDQKEYAALLRHLEEDEAMEHARACAWLRLLGECRRKSDLQEFGINTKAELFRLVLARLQKEDLKPLRITNKRVLHRKIKQYQEEGWEAILHGLKGNSNAAKIITQDQEDMLIALMGDPHKPDTVTVTYLYNKEAGKRDWPELAPSTVRRFLEKPEVRRVWWMARHGKDAYYQEYDLTILRKRPTKPDLLWVLDGTPLDLYFRKTEDRWNAKRQKWEQRTSVYNRMDMILVADACTWRIHGAVLCEHENADAVRRSLKHAVSNTMRLPKQLTYDQGSGMAAQQWLIDQLNVLNTPTRPYNAKAKVIENIIGHFQNKILRYYDNWAGMGVRTRKEDSHFNPDFLTEQKNNIPELNELQMQFQETIKIWNELPTKKRKAPNVAYLEPSAGRSIDPLEFIGLFWEKRRHEYRYRQEGITIQVNNQPHTFQVTDAKLVSKLLGGKYQAAIDPDSMDYIYLYKDDKPVLDNGEPVMAMAAELVPMAIGDYEEGDRARVNKLIKLKDEVRDIDMDRVSQIKKFAKEEEINLGARYVYKDRLNDAENAFKVRRLQKEDDEWAELLQQKYRE